MEHKSIILYFIIKKNESILLLLREFEMNILKCRIFVLIHLNLKRYYDLHMMKISIDILLTQYLLCRFTYFKNIMSSFLSIQRYQNKFNVFKFSA